MVIRWKYYRTKKPVRVRLANIDAPEKKQPFGRWSATQLKDLVAGKPVTVQYAQTDRYGRILGRVYTADGTEANRWQVRNGAARVYPDYNNDYTLPPLQRDARALKRGLWADKKSGTTMDPGENRIRNNYLLI